MEKPKGFADRVEGWMARIPGVRTYKDRENRRETDKKLRGHLSSRLQEMRSSLKKVILDLTTQGKMDPLAKLDRLSSRLQQMADTIGYASYGYGGVFDREKIRKEELDRLYSFDLSLMEDLDKIQAEVAGIGQDPSSAAMDKKTGEADRLLDALEKRFRQRGEFMSKPA